MSEKDIAIQNLRKELITYKFDDQELIKEITTLFPTLTPFSIGKQLTVNTVDSTKMETVLFYSGKEKMDNKELSKLRDWLNIKLAGSDIKILKGE